MKIPNGIQYLVTRIGKELVSTHIIRFRKNDPIYFAKQSNVCYNGKQKKGLFVRCYKNSNACHLDPKYLYSITV